MTTTNLRGRVVALERRQAPRRIDCTREERDEREARAAYEAAFAAAVAAVGGEAAWRDELATQGVAPAEGESGLDTFPGVYLEPEEWAAWIERQPAIGMVQAACARWKSAATALHLARLLARCARRGQEPAMRQAER